MAGLCAAVSAVEAGARPLVIEKGAATRRLDADVRRHGLDGADRWTSWSVGARRRSGSSAPAGRGDPGRASIGWRRSACTLGKPIANDRTGRVRGRRRRAHRAYGPRNRGPRRRGRRRDGALVAGAGPGPGPGLSWSTRLAADAAPCRRARSCSPPAASRATHELLARYIGPLRRVDAAGARTRGASGTGCSPRWRPAPGRRPRSRRSTATRCRHRRPTRRRPLGRR